jgi:hypothetical protein
MSDNQTNIPYAFHNIPANAMLEVAAVIKSGGEKYGNYNYLYISQDEHINHAIAHLYLFLSGDRTEEHLVHATCRAMFAAEIQSILRKADNTDEDITGE